MGHQKESAQSRAQGVVSYGKRQMDRVVSPAARQNAYDATMVFASERPILFAFIASQLFFSLLPLVLFFSFAASTLMFALVAAVVFSLFWIGVALLFLVPTLFVTGSLALVVWLWAVSAFVVARWVYNIMPASVRGGGPSNDKKAAIRNKSFTNGKDNGKNAQNGSDSESRGARVKSENGNTYE